MAELVELTGAFPIIKNEKVHCDTYVDEAVTNTYNLYLSDGEKPDSPEGKLWNNSSIDDKLEFIQIFVEQLGELIFKSHHIKPK